MQEYGVPVVNNMQFSGSDGSQTIGPFNTIGTFHLYCSVHPGQRLPSSLGHVAQQFAMGREPLRRHVKGLRDEEHKTVIP
jgi:hypothetical protein